jgi:hypothetical protein
VLFDDKEPDQVSFDAYRQLDSSFREIDKTTYGAAIQKIRCIRHNAIAHWNSKNTLHGWLKKFSLATDDIELALRCVRELHDYLRGIDLADDFDLFAKIEKQTRREIDDFIEKLRDSRRFLFVDAEAKKNAIEMYEVHACLENDQSAES